MKPLVNLKSQEVLQVYIRRETFKEREKKRKLYLQSRGLSCRSSMKSLSQLLSWTHLHMHEVKCRKRVEFTERKYGRFLHISVHVASSV